jgi:quercetin dioxygenase-like cupin family protein
MKSILPTTITKLPKAQIPFSNVNIYIPQQKENQIVFMEFEKDTDIPEHTHAEQWEYVLHGSVDIWIDGKQHIFQKGDQFFIPAGVKHHAKVHAGYASIAFFNEKDRYKIES